MYDIQSKKVNTLIRPDGTKKAYVRLTPALDVVQVLNSVGSGSVGFASLSWESSSLCGISSGVCGGLKSMTLSLRALRLISTGSEVNYQNDSAKYKFTSGVEFTFTLHDKLSHQPSTTSLQLKEEDGIVKDRLLPLAVC
ncbi:hypothetical protein NC653_002557 [Populus alba x Populus x berolinensis]|uniref:Uncharacterized protein n=1 Tax=Populus alba x Populus x berolinensis TaxID=444605 RepID=A0AAD6RPE7_9ROSI|nr:hypothetical protein NC653_002557 [Populus alba x Populus x berolinensis]